MVQKGREEKEKRPPLLLTSVQKENKEQQSHKKTGLAQKGKPGTFTLGTNTVKKRQHAQAKSKGNLRGTNFRQKKENLAKTKQPGQPGREQQQQPQQHTC